jgi:hypothetical protein
MKRPALTLLIALAVVLGRLTGAAIDIIPPEGSVAERVRNLEVVLLVRAVSEPTVRAEDILPSLRAANPDVIWPPDEKYLTPIIEQDVEVLEVMKGHAAVAAGTTIRVGTSGGHNAMHLAEGWRERRTMAARGTYVLFLSQHRPSTQLRYYYFDLFRLDPPRVTVPNGETAYGTTLAGMSPAGALSLIRDAVKNAQR